MLSAIATPLVAIFLGPAIPPGNGSVQATGQVFDNKVLVSVSTPVCVFVLLFLALRAHRASGALAARSSTDRRFAATRGSSSSGWSSRPSTVLCLAGFGTYELVQNGAGGGQGPDAAFQPAAYKQRWTSR